MSSKYSVTKGNECVNYAEIYSFLMREEPRRATLSFPSFFFSWSLFFQTTVTLHMKDSRSKVMFHRSTALAAFRCCLQPLL